MMKTDVDYLLHAVKTLHPSLKNQTQIAEFLGVVPQELTNWKTRGIPKGKLLGFARKIGCRPEYLESGEEPMVEQNEVRAPTEEEFAIIQQIDIAASCGNGRNFQDHVVIKGGLAFKKSFLRHAGVNAEQARIIYADGQSMEPWIKSGCVVLINTRDNEPQDGKVFLICDPDGAVYLKRLVREYNPAQQKMVWVMRSDNPDKNQFPDKFLPEDERTIIVGRAVWNDNLL